MTTIFKRGVRFVEYLKHIGVHKLLAPSTCNQCQQPQRHLNVHEHISYSLLKEAGIPVPNFGVAKTKSEARTIADGLRAKNMVCKAQVLAGGRAKGTFKNGLKGGVKMVKTPAEAEDIAGQMLGQYLVTKQTGEKGRICNAVMVTEQKFPTNEYYFAVMMERAFSGPVLIASSHGGVNIEETAAKTPDAIHYLPIDIIEGLTKEKAALMAEKVGLRDKKSEVGKILMRLYKLFLSKDALLIEVNPFAQETSGQFFCLDAKFRFDDTAEYRQKALFALRDSSQEDEKEVHAKKFGLSYVALDGNIGCLVNGAGLAMATMDLIHFHGGKPANFLDVGGGATREAVREAFKIITADPNVKSILVNIYGGIMRCDIIAQGIIDAAKELKQTAVICRLHGQMLKEATELLQKSGLAVVTETDYDTAARKVIAAAAGK